jgi:hypothetical protein
MTAIVVKVLTFLKRLVVKSSHSHDCWSTTVRDFETHEDYNR